MADINTVAQQTSELLTDYANLLRTWFTMFYDPTPQDITLSLYDDEGNLQSYTFPNRSKDFTYILNGSGTPQGVKTATVGSIYQDILNGEVYIKNSINTDTNWTKVISKEVLDTYIIQGNNAPEGNIFSTKGVLYVDLINCGLYIKTTSSGNTGWINIGGSVSIATKISLGSVQIGDNIDVDTNGVISSPLATDSIFGVIKTGTGITAVDGVISVTNTNYELIGSVKYWLSETAPDGWLRLAGQTLTVVDFQEITDFANNNNLRGIDKLFGGDGTSSLIIPNFDGQFIRCWDGSGSIDPARICGSFQEDDFKAHTHDMYTSSGGSLDVQPTVNYIETNDPDANELLVENVALTRGGTETRPKNVSLSIIIKVKNIGGVDPLVIDGNADTLDGLHASAFALVNHNHTGMLKVLYYNDTGVNPTNGYDETIFNHNLNIDPLHLIPKVALKCIINDPPYLAGDVIYEYIDYTTGDRMSPNSHVVMTNNSISVYNGAFKMLLARNGSNGYISADTSSWTYVITIIGVGV